MNMDNLSPASRSAEDVDAILAPIEPFLDEFETECVAACCGIDAYNFDPEAIRIALGKVEADARANLSARFRAVLEALEQRPAGRFASVRMNQYFAKEELLELLRVIAREVDAR